jgi:hypothetical protein
VTTNPNGRVEVTVPDGYCGSKNGCKIDVDEILLLKDSRYAFEVGLVSGVGGR